MKDLLWAKPWYIQRWKREVPDLMEVINREFQTVVNYMKKHQNDGRMNGYREMLLITWAGISSLSRWYLNGDSISLYFSVLMYPVFSIR